jgi:hypothetical protein
MEKLRTTKMSELGFSYEIKNDEIWIIRSHRAVTTLRGQKAQNFLEDVTRLDQSSLQQLMARLTGNYKRGNEKQGKRRRSNKYS